jgi:hypothetical protein
MRRNADGRANQGKLEEGGASSGDHCAQAADQAARSELSPNQAEVPDDISLGNYASHSASLSTNSQLQNQGRFAAGARRDSRAPNQPYLNRRGDSFLTHWTDKIPELLGAIEMAGRAHRVHRAPIRVDA